MCMYKVGFAGCPEPAKEEASCSLSVIIKVTTPGAWFSNVVASEASEPEPTGKQNSQI